MGSENAHASAQNAENGFGFDFLEWYHKDGNEILSHTVRVTGDEPWVSFIQVKTKEQSNKRFQPATKLMASVFWDKKRVLMVEFTQQGTTVMSEVYCETMKGKKTA
jgi:hypothetical protein